MNNNDFLLQTMYHGIDYRYRDNKEEFIMELQGKKVLVFGSGKSGIGASDLLAKVGAVPVIYDGNADIDKEAVVHKTNGTYPLEIYAEIFRKK